MESLWDSGWEFPKGISTKPELRNWSAWRGQLGRSVGPPAQRNGEEIGFGICLPKKFERAPPFRPAGRRSGQAGGAADEPRADHVSK